MHTHDILQNVYSESFNDELCKLGQLIKEAKGVSVGRALKKVWSPFGNQREIIGTARSQFKGTIRQAQSNIRTAQTGVEHAILQSDRNIKATSHNLQKINKSVERLSKPSAIERSTGLGTEARERKLSEMTDRLSNAQRESAVLRRKATRVVGEATREAKHATALGAQTLHQARAQYRSTVGAARRRETGNVLVRGGIGIAGVAGVGAVTKHLDTTKHQNIRHVRYH